MITPRSNPYRTGRNTRILGSSPWRRRIRRWYRTVSNSIRALLLRKAKQDLEFQIPLEWNAAVSLMIDDLIVRIESAGGRVS